MNYQEALRIPETLDQKFIHIAGTNGKGSVSAMLSFVLQEAGYKVGLFISPYIVDFRERIQSIFASASRSITR